MAGNMWLALRVPLKFFVLLNAKRWTFIVISSLYSSQEAHKLLSVHFNFALNSSHQLMSCRFHYLCLAGCSTGHIRLQVSFHLSEMKLLCVCQRNVIRKGAGPNITLLYGCVLYCRFRLRTSRNWDKSLIWLNYHCSQHDHSQYSYFPSCHVMIQSGSRSSFPVYQVYIHNQMIIVQISETTNGKKNRFGKKSSRQFVIPTK